MPKTPVEIAHHDGAAIGVAARVLAREVPVALTINGSTEVVMMASPADLQDFALGFAFTEGAIAGLSDVVSTEIVPHAEGMEARLWLKDEAAARMAARRRLIAGPTGCGLCGVESLEAARKPARQVVAGGVFAPAMIAASFRALEAAQALGAETGATHAAALFHPMNGLVAVREDVGRHNALDKLAGHALRAGAPAYDLAQGAMVLITSRVSIEMVQKAAMMNAPLLAAISAPTDLAVATAEAAGITLVALARGREFDIHTHRERIG